MVSSLRHGIKTKSQPVAIPSRLRGTRISKILCLVVPPEIRQASSREGDICLKAAVIVLTAKPRNFARYAISIIRNVLYMEKPSTGIGLIQAIMKASAMMVPGMDLGAVAKKSRNFLPGIRDRSVTRAIRKPITTQRLAAEIAKMNEFLKAFFISVSVPKAIKLLKVRLFSVGASP